MWRKPGEEFIKDMITERWKGFSEFMWWSAFSWDFKSTPHIWQPETGAYVRKAGRGGIDWYR